MSKRRNLLALIGTVILLVSLSVPMMQCAPAAEEEVTPPPEEEVTPPAEEEEEIKYGGRLNVGTLNPLESLSFMGSMMQSNWGWMLIELVYDTLESASPPEMSYYDFTPRIVQSYEVSEDGNEWTLHLTEDATFHDGVPLTAEDVKFTFDYFVSSPTWGDWDVCFDYTEVIDEYTVRYVNTESVASTNVPGWWNWDPVIPKHIFEPYKDDVTLCPNEEAIGSGAFKLKEFKPAQYMWLVANDDYWQGRPYLDEIVFINYNNIDTMLMALEMGEIDTIMDTAVPSSRIADLEAKPDIEIEMLRGSNIQWLTFNLHKDTALRDKSVRQAILYGIDRGRLIDMIWMGNGATYDSFLYEEDPVHNPDLPQYDYNPEKANQILETAGYIDTDGDGIRNAPDTGENLIFELICPSGNVDRVKAATLIAEQLPKIGIGIDFSAVDYGTYSEVVFDPEADAYEIALHATEPGPSPYSDWMWLFAMSWGALGDGTWYNSAYYDNPHFNELVSALRAASDMQKRKAYLYEMQEILCEDVPYAFLVRPQHALAYRTDKFEGWNWQMGAISWYSNLWNFYRIHLK